MLKLAYEFDKRIREINFNFWILFC